MDLAWIIKQLRSQQMIYESFLNHRERLLLKFNDRHAIYSNSEHMDDLGASESDLMATQKKQAEIKDVSVSQILKSELQKSRRQCTMIKEMDERLALHVGQHRKRDVIDDLAATEPHQSASQIMRNSHYNDANGSGRPHEIDALSKNKHVFASIDTKK